MYVSVCPPKPEKSLVFFDSRSLLECCSVSQMPLFFDFLTLILQLHIRRKICWATFLIRGSENLSFTKYFFCHMLTISAHSGAAKLQNVRFSTKMCNTEHKLQLHCWFESELLKVCPSVFCVRVRSPLTAPCVNDVSVTCTDTLCLHCTNSGRNVFFFPLVAGMP